MIKHGETVIITDELLMARLSQPLNQMRAECAIAYFATAAREHPAARRSRFRRRVWRDDQSLGDRIHAATAARRLSTVADAQLDQALADLRDGVTP
jgi:hypothetical protein